MSALTVSCGAAGVAETAFSRIEEAEEAVNVAYEMVWEAEECGADVSGLLVELGMAGELLADAKVCYRTMDFEGAVEAAEAALEGVEGLGEAAEELRASALLEERERSFRWVAGSGLGVAVAVLVFVLGWRVFKRRYVERVLGWKPEVAEDES